MKRTAAILLAIIAAIVLLAFAGCSSGSTEPPTEVATQAPTDAPYIDTQIDEPEWTLADGHLTLEDGSGNTLAQGSDFLYFAVVGAEPSQMELRFKFSDASAAVLQTQGPDTSYYVSIDGELVGKAQLSEDFTTATVKASDAQGEIPELATKIRGLYN